MTQNEYAPLPSPLNKEDAPTSSGDNDHQSVHHRKPKNIKGSDSARNRSYVLRSKHDAWHILYGALPATEIISLFEADQEIYGDWIPKSNIQRRINESWANSSKEKIKRRKAWYYLFEAKSLEEVVREINTVWIDPDYQIAIGIERIKKVWLKSSKK